MFRLEIKTGGSAFRDENVVDKNGDFGLDPYATEVRRILMDISKRLERGFGSGKVTDINGNGVGWWSYE